MKLSVKVLVLLFVISACFYLPGEGGGGIKPLTRE